MNFYGITPVKRQGKNASGYEGFRLGVLIEPLSVDGKSDFMSFLFYKNEL
jgi:hypothetical protein